METNLRQKDHASQKWGGLFHIHESQQMHALYSKESLRLALNQNTLIYMHNFHPVQSHRKLGCEFFRPNHIFVTINEVIFSFCGIFSEFWPILWTNTR